MILQDSVSIPDTGELLSSLDHPLRFHVRRNKLLFFLHYHCFEVISLQANQILTTVGP